MDERWEEPMVKESCKHLGDTQRGRHPRREGSKREKTQGRKKHTARQQSETKSKKNGEKEKEKESGKRKKENTIEIGAYINRPFSPPLSKPTL